MARKFKILFVCSEVAPLVKTGGLADVCAVLPNWLAELGHQVEIVIPNYQAVEEQGVECEEVVKKIEVSIADRQVVGRVLAAKNDRPWRALLVDQPELFRRPGLYVDQETGRDYPDNAARFAFFAKAVIKMIQRRRVRYDIVHAHDWQTALVVTYLRLLGKNSPLLAYPASLFTIHNLGYQGLFPAEDGRYFDLPPGLFTPEQMEFHGKWGLLKGAVLHADWVSTVSARYAKEIQTKELGFGLHEVFQRRSETLAGITHGADEEEWNPATDPHIAAQYHAGDLAGKQVCKADLLRAFALPGEWGKRPVLGFVGRLIEQKGLDLILQIADDLVAHGYTMVFLGLGEKKYESALKELATRHPHFVGLRLDFDEKLAHQIQAGADMFLMPSLYEPCGLTQMYAQKYGALPVVRATGGLDDTVKGWSRKAKRPDGFKFAEAKPEALLKTLADAADLFSDRPEWEKLMKNAMELDHSWLLAARNYERLYRRMRRSKEEAEKSSLDT